MIEDKKQRDISSTEPYAGRQFKYNPAFLNEQELVDSFCIHQLELNILVDTVKRNTLSANQHVLVIGPRGSGKTTLVRRLCAEVMRQPELSSGWQPIICSEELYEAISLDDFWLEVLFYASRQNGTSQEKLQEIYAELKQKSKSTANLGELALEKLLEFADSLKKRLLIVCENMNDLFGGALGDKDAWGLRRVLQNEPRIMLLATATKPFAMLSTKDRPLFDTFKLLELKRLTTEECRILWRHCTGREMPLSQARALQILTGGLPRLMVLLANFGKDLSFLNLMDNLEKLVDDHTEYFKSSIESIPVKERKVFVSLATLWQNASASQVAQSARMDVRETSALLNRLVSRGIVIESESQNVGLKRNPKTYQLTERLFNIYYLMRRGDYDYFVKDFVRFIAQVFQEDFLFAVEGFRTLKRGELSLKQQVHYDTCMSVIGEFNGTQSTSDKSNQLTRISQQGIGLCKEGNWFEASACFREALKIASKRLGAQHPETLVNMNNLAVSLSNLGFFSEALALHKRCLEIRGNTLGNTHHDTLESQSNLGASLNQLGFLEEAKALHEKTLRSRLHFLGNEHPETLMSMNNLAATMERLGECDQARKLHEKTLELRSKLLGPEHPETLSSMNNLANTLDALGELDLAHELHKKTLSARVQLMGNHHPATLISRNNLANTLGRMNQLYEAEVLHRNTLKARIQTLGEEHPDTLTSANNLGVTLGKQGQLNEAELLHKQTLEGRTKILGKDHPDVLLSANDLASVLVDERRPPDFKKAQESLELFEETSVHPHARFFLRTLTTTCVSIASISETHAKRCVEILQSSPQHGIFTALIAGIKSHLELPFQAAEEMRDVASDIAEWIENSKNERAQEGRTPPLVEGA